MPQPLEQLPKTTDVDLSMAAKGEDTTQLARLDDMKARATLKYAVKDYNAAAELYSEATELQAELNGEMSSQNAELLYNYGRCLYHVAVKNSDVLGTKVAGEQREEKSNHAKAFQKPGKRRNGVTNGVDRVNEEVVTKVIEKKQGLVEDAEEVAKDADNKPFFQFTGDENFDDSEEENEDDVGDEKRKVEEDGEEDDFANAYEALDLARVLLLKRIEEEHASSDSATAYGDSSSIKHLKGLLADTHDLQAEISLEGERFPNAVADIKESLALKLSLALEFSSVTQQKNENGEIAEESQAQVDEAMREEAAKELELAISSCQLRVTKEQASLNAGMASPDTGAKGQATQGQIDDVKDMIKDMEQRLVELRQPPVSINDPTSTGTLDGSNPLSGILGSILGESPDAQKARLEEASKDAKDLTNLVRRKKPSTVSSPRPSVDDLPSTNGKRKVEFDEETVEVGTGKKTKLEDGEE